MDQIKNRKQLTVFPGKNVTGDPTWSRVFADVITEFNQLSASLQLGVTLVDARTTTPPTGPPDPNVWPGGADVQLEAGTGTVQFTAQGDTTSCTVLSGPGALQANTALMAYKIGTQSNFVVRLKRSFILLPIHPQLKAALVPPVRGQSQRQREAGPAIKLFLAIHELIHACGLENSDHSTGATADVFVLQPDFSAGTFPNPQDDRGVVNGRTMPPIFISSQTQGNIQGIWR
jgi:hypothetical protein